ncbi:hypothetical protein [Microbacterium sp. Root180]|uniref:hypothetical protein n=1 Tax=Microbacterium sp. Root180 TaxID=1736483 RepID=UPI0006F93F36|nr:hypothetical protein [Microbacterium sp. Root180]KRB38822.1 hypothetical protein ASD93_02460 [Microbacterium sp. Root180]
MTAQAFSREEHARVRAESRAFNRQIPLSVVREKMQWLAQSTDPEQIELLAQWRAGMWSLTAINGDELTFTPREPKR